MILSLFLPERIGGYHLLTKRIVGIEITKHALYATVIQLKGTSKTIEALFQEPISTIDGPYDEEIVTALRAIKLKLGKYDKIYCSLPSSQVIFKELTLPFTGIKKIKLVVPFEVESQLPFNLDEGVVDCIVTGINNEEQQTDVMVGAIQHENIARYIDYFEDAGLKLEKASVDIFELYSLFHSLQDAAEGSVALIEIGLSETTLGLIIDGRLKYIRSFKKELSLQDGELILDATMKERLTSLLEQVRITVDTALQKYAPGKHLSKAVITGAITSVQDVPGVSSIVKQALESEVNLVQPNDLITAGVFTSKVTTIPGTFMSSIALASSPEKTENFTFLQAQAHKEENQLIVYQLLTIAVLVISFFLTFSLYSFLRVRTLKNAYKLAEQEAIKELQKNFKLPAKKVTRLDLANKAAQDDLKKQETAWRRISPDNRYAYLKYLAELTKCINMKESELQLDSIILKDDTIKLYGKVPGYKQLTRLQDQLECRLFKRLPKLQSFNFKTEPITLIVDQEEL